MIPGSITKYVIHLPRYIKRTIVVLNDAILCILTVWFSFYLRLGEFIPISLSNDANFNIIKPSLFSIVVAIPVFTLFGFYRSIFRYSGWFALKNIINGSIFYFLIYATLVFGIGFDQVPRTVGIIQPVLLLLAVGGSRGVARFWLSGRYKKIFIRDNLTRKILIYGAGEAGQQLAATLSNLQDCKVVGFLDDNQKLHNNNLNGVNVFSPDNVCELVRKLSVTEIVLALPSISRKRRNEIISKITIPHVIVHTIPSISDLINKKVMISDIRDLDIDDLLGREQIDYEFPQLKKDISNSIVLVTGAGGSIGSELCRQLIKLLPRIILLVDQSEHALYSINQELDDLSKEFGVILTPLLCSVSDQVVIERIISHWQPDIVYHAAAYKHVPLVEHNPVASVNNNVLGTLILAQIAAKYSIKRFILVSSDKAVRPTNIMGATKRLAEMILQALADNKTNTIFSMVRFGNVLDSSGSVVPRFRQQIRNGGPITLTHPDITRYFMTIPEAAQLVIQAGIMAVGGEVFILDMGQPVKILDLARRMIELSGFTVKDSDNPDGDLEIKIIGLRPGEKLYEELLIGSDIEFTENSKIVKSKDKFLNWDILEKEINKLESAMNASDIIAMQLIFKDLIEGYKPMDHVVDWISSDLKKLVE